MSCKFGGFGTKVQVVESSIYKKLRMESHWQSFQKSQIHNVSFGNSERPAKSRSNCVIEWQWCKWHFYSERVYFLHIICQLLFFILLEVWALYGAKKIIFMLHLVSHGYPKIQSISLHCCHVLFCNPKMLWHFLWGDYGPVF